MTYLTPTPDPWNLALSISIACLSAYVLFDLAKRVRGEDRGVALFWLLGGSFAVGTGLWTSHFLGLYARVTPAAVGYAALGTFVSWIAAAGAAMIVLAIAMRRRLTRLHLVGGSVAISTILCLMHHTGVAAIVAAPPGIAWNLGLVGIEGAIGILLSIVLLLALDGLRDARGVSGAFRQVLASMVIGLGLGVMHLVAMSATHIPVNAIHFSELALDGEQLGAMALLAAFLGLGCALVSSIGYGWLETRRGKLAGSLKTVEARLESVDHDLRQQAMRDSLTGLPIRLVFEERLEKAQARTERLQQMHPGPAEKFAVLFIDIDGFKPVNESLGYAGSDEVICTVARRIADQVRDGHTVARLGGDQFLVLMEGVSANSDCVQLARRVLEAVKVPFQVADRRVQISVSIGIAVYPDHGDGDKLLARADTAMQAAKRAGCGTYALFESHMRKGEADQLDLIGDLRQALERGEISLHYQPKIDGRRGVICGVEALLRWTHPVRGSVSPAVFIPVAERFGFINTLGDWVIEEACRQMHSWAQAGVQMRVAINLSVHQLNELDLVSRIAAALKRHGVKSSHLLCEITESVAMQDIDATQRTLDALGHIGVYLSIDDFGTGYSSLSYLRQLPARQLKIDRSFIKDLDTGDHARAVVDAVVRLAHALGLRVVAEGVETARQRDILLELGCDELQGYFFAHPMPADSLLEWTAGKKPKGTVDFARSLVFDPVGRQSAGFEPVDA